MHRTGKAFARVKKSDSICIPCVKLGYLLQKRLWNGNDVRLGIITQLRPTLPTVDSSTVHNKGSIMSNASVVLRVS